MLVLFGDLKNSKHSKLIGVQFAHSKGMTSKGHNFHQSFNVTKLIIIIIIISTPTSLRHEMLCL